MSQPKRFSPDDILKAGMSIIQAHSGCENTPPNSVEHIKAGIASGAEFIEIDIRADGDRLFLSHDPAAHPSSCVQFDTFLELIAPYPSLYVNCDVKTEGLLKPVTDAFKKKGADVSRIVFTGACNDKKIETDAMGAGLWYSLWTARDAEKDEQQIVSATEYCKQVGCPIINLYCGMINSNNIKYVRDNGLDFSAWTVDDEEQLRFLLERRIANITTRKPLLALKLRDEIQGTPEQNGLKPVN